MIAKRNIKAGEEVTDFYGSHYFQSPRPERHQMLGFRCQCRACRENYPLMRSLAQFTKVQKKHRVKWSEARDKLDDAVARMKVVETLTLCKVLANTNNVITPHECMILPELYLHYSSVFLFGNKSLAFRIFSDKVILNEIEV